MDIHLGAGSKGLIILSLSIITVLLMAQQAQAQNTTELRRIAPPAAMNASPSGRAFLYTRRPLQGARPTASEGLEANQNFVGTVPLATECGNDPALWILCYLGDTATALLVALGSGTGLASYVYFPINPLSVSLEYDELQEWNWQRIKPMLWASKHGGGLGLFFNF